MDNLWQEYDVPSFIPDIPLKLDRVGTTERSVNLLFESGDKVEHVSSHVAMFVSLPSHRRGIHASRLASALQKRSTVIYSSPQQFALLLAQDILDLQEADGSCVELRFIWNRLETTPITKNDSLQSYEIFTQGQVLPKGKKKVSIGVKIPCITACPCVQLNAREYYNRYKDQVGLDYDQFQELIKVVPIFSHTQRVYLTIELKNGDLRLADFDFRDLITSVKRIVPTSNDLLKRIDEVEIVKKAHLAPLFCEDIVRVVAKNICFDFRNYFSGDEIIEVEAESLESIHSYNIFSRLELRFDEIANILCIDK